MKGKFVYTKPTAKIEYILAEDILTLSQASGENVGSVTPISWKDI